MILDIEEIKDTFNVDIDSQKDYKLRHNHCNNIRILPYITSNPSEKALDFTGVLGHFSRLLSKNDFSDKVDKNEIIEKAIEKVNTKNKTSLKDIINKVFFNEQEELKVFHPKIFNYISLKDSKQKKIAEFLYSVLLNDENKDLFLKTCNSKPNNILEHLILEAMPSLKDGIKLRKSYKSYFSFVAKVFNEDFKFMINDSEFFVEHFGYFLNYYYFYYVSQLALHLNRMFSSESEKPIPLYFNLDWEKASKSRTSYKQGWRFLEEPVNCLFSHAICLEFLNHLKGIEKPYGYNQIIIDVVEDMNKAEIDAFVEQLDELILLYKYCTEDIDWEKYSTLGQRYDNPVKNKICELFKTIDFQFNNPPGNRQGPYKKYSNWFKDFCKKEFLQPRGRLGYRLKLSQEYLIFITKLCIKNEPKIRLKKLFEEFKRRGLFFDKYSKQEIIEVFEKLNILEKKSDSGDAQYVRAIL
ncbi:hypothetical protein JCM16358_20560 [Halanaerocella petrolearia]